MTTQASRRDFLRGDIPSSEILRPPGAKSIGFRQACIGCADCAEACPQAIIQSDGRGAVQLDLSRRHCTFCGDCARACPTDALDPARVADWPWVAQVAPQCLSLNQVSCRACEDACDARAIRFRLETGGNARPMIDAPSCTGCGACISICPAGAVTLSRRPSQVGEITA